MKRFHIGWILGTGAFLLGAAGEFVRAEDAEGTDVVFSLGSRVAAPGETVRVPFSVWSNRDVCGVAFAVRFDPAVLKFIRGEPVWQLPEGKPWPFGIHTKETLPEALTSGWLTCLAIFESESGAGGIPANAETHVLDLVFLVLPDAEAGPSPLRFENMNSPTGWRWSNAAGVGQPCAPGLYPGEGGMIGASVLAGAALHVIAEPAFRRGDANADGTVDLSDAVSTLSYLFEGQGRPLCEDALDANDDGALDISDPITVLAYLFLGGPPLAAPSSDCGHDVTQDDLSCAQYAACP